MRRPLRFRVIGVLGCVLALGALAAFPAAVAGDPGGNNGTVKIHDGATDTEPTVRNEPHVCTFHLHFLFADAGQTGAWEIRAWAPAGTGEIVLDGSYETADDGTDRQPVEGAYELPDGHYKLFWEGRNDHNLKHKTFWVACEVEPVIPETPTPPETEGPSGSELAAEGTPRPTPPSTDVQATGVATAGWGLGMLLLAAVSVLVLLATPRIVRKRQ